MLTEVLDSIDEKSRSSRVDFLEVCDKVADTRIMTMTQETETMTKKTTIHPDYSDYDLRIMARHFSADDLGDLYCEAHLMGETPIMEMCDKASEGDEAARLYCCGEARSRAAARVG
jgi:hypothetical protein